jgi:hypothetical protein
MDVSIFVNKYTRALREKNAAIFAGAGLSRASGFVDWKQLLKSIANELHLDIDKENDLVSLTQYHINENLGNRHVINQTLIQEFTKDNKINENHRILAELPIETYWTTNYDTLIEDALKEFGKTPDVKKTQENLAINIPRRDAIIYKMHGDISMPNEAVISKDDYEIYNLRRPLFTTALQGDLISKTFLFIGVSFDDPNINQVMGRMRGLLEGNQREHYCFLKKINLSDYKTSSDYEYAKVKQELKIKDLKRYCIKEILVDDYSKITDILEKIRSSFKRNVIFISGSAEDYGKWGEETSLDFVHKLSNQLSKNSFKIVSGMGRGIGRTVINGCLEYVFSSKFRHLDEYLILRPFPKTSKEDRTTIYKEYRNDMISNAGIAIFIFGNKEDDENGVVEASGITNEFEIAKNLGLKLIPIGATGFTSKTLWKKIIGNFDIYFPEYPELELSFEALGDNKKTPDERIKETVKIVKILRGE